MKRKMTLVLLKFLFIIVVTNEDYQKTESQIFFINKINDTIIYPNKQEEFEVIIALVVCGDRVKQALVAIKSAIIFQKSSKLRFIVLCELHLQNELSNDLETMKYMSHHSFTYQILNVSFPKENEKTWKNLFEPCSAQRLFLPNILINESKVLYIDTDVLFLNEISDIWSHWNSMNSSHICAMAPDEATKHKFYNLSCKYNYGYGACSFMMCKDAEQDGVSLLHGFGRSFTLNKVPPFRKLYLAFSNYEIGTNVHENLSKPLESALKKTINSTCGSAWKALMKRMNILFPKRENYIQKITEIRIAQ
ncbi:hypothetical protein PGB90_003162 [Kerria lacca]